MSENTELQNAEQSEDNEEVVEDEQEEYVYTESKVITLFKCVFNIFIAYIIGNYRTNYKKSNINQSKICSYNSCICIKDRGNKKHS